MMRTVVITMISSVSQVTLRSRTSHTFADREDWLAERNDDPDHRQCSMSTAKDEVWLRDKHDAPRGTSKSVAAEGTLSGKGPRAADTEVRER
jgi:hypothetical protein